jgi:hypothetical protein
LEHYGIRGLVLYWINNYFSNTLNSICWIQWVTSSFNNIKCGVPQGSILGPLFFLLYINDLCNVSNIFYLVLFADDTNLFFLTMIHPVWWMCLILNCSSCLNGSKLINYQST